MAMKFKVNSGAADLKRFVGLITDRESAIKNAPENEINPTFKINEIAKELHPDFQKMVITEIISHDGADAKTFVFKKADGSKAAFFRAGQYVSVLLKMGESLVTRPYSICSSPMEAKQGVVKITVRNVKDGYAAPYMLENFKVGDNVTLSGPDGTFYYEPLRDAQTVIALAGGSGITPFLSMAYAIRDGLEDFNLTILFGSRNEENILFKNELDEIAAECEKVKIVHILSDEEKEGYEHGFINAELIKKYAPADGKYSVFICGPEAMYRFAEKEVEKLGIEKKYFRRELLGVTKNAYALPDYPEDAKNKTFKLTVVIGENEWVVDAKSDETVLTAVERAGIPAPSRCRSGECGWCRSKLVSGTVYIPAENDTGRRYTDKECGYIHPCASFPTSDLKIAVPGSYMK